MTLSDFATKYRLKLSIDSCGDPFIICQIDDCNISEFSARDDATKLAMCFITDSHLPPRSGLWNRIKGRCLAAGMKLHQAGDAEGIFVFDPADPVQARLAIKSVRAKRNPIKCNQ